MERGVALAQAVGRHVHIRCGPVRGHMCCSGSLSGLRSGLALSDLNFAKWKGRESHGRFPHVAETDYMVGCRFYLDLRDWGFCLLQPSWLIAADFACVEVSM